MSSRIERYVTGRCRLATVDVGGMSGYTSFCSYSSAWLAEFFRERSDM
jgi:hypothetical protein